MGSTRRGGSTITVITGLLLSLLFPTLAHAANNSVRFSGSNYLTSASNTGTQFNYATNGAFTLEWWQKMDSTYQSNNMRIFSIGCYNADPVQGTKLGVSVESGQIYFWANGAAIVSAVGKRLLDRWAHIAITRNTSGVINIWENGVSIGNATWGDAITASGAKFAVGAEEANCPSRTSTEFVGLLAGLRISNSALYSTSFTPTVGYSVSTSTFFMGVAPSNTGSTSAAIVLSNTGSVVSDAEIPVVQKPMQADLSITTYSATYKTPIKLTTSGGSTGLPVTYVVDGGSCTMSGETLTALAGTGTCYVTATMPANASYDTATSGSYPISLNKASLTISGISIANKIYDGTTAATISGAALLSGLFSGDTATLVSTSASAVFATAAVGTNKSVTVSGFTISGGQSANYSLTQPTGLTASITGGAPTMSGTAPLTASFRTLINLTFSTAASTAPGKVTFTINRRRLPGCISRAINASNSYSMTCAWYPSVRGSYKPIATFTPTDSSFSQGVYSYSSVVITGRTNRR